MDGGNKKPGKTKLDALVVERGLAATLAEARALIMAGKILVADQRIDKPGTAVSRDAAVRLKSKRQGNAERFVSRAGDKLAAAVEDLAIGAAFKEAVVLDVGASTGGFTHCSLELGAKQVIALDVGSNQLAWELRQDARVTALEQTDIRDFKPESQPPIDIVVSDVSFNAMARLAPALKQAAPRSGVHFLVLIKPQFELPRHEVPDGGVVTNAEARARAVDAVIKSFAAVGLGDGTTVESRVAGRSGNVEVFYYVRAR